MKLRSGSERAVSAWAWRVVNLQGLVALFWGGEKVEGEILGMLWCDIFGGVLVGGGW